MVKHIVMFRFKEEAEGRTRQENVQMTKDMLDALQGVVPTLLSSKVAINDKRADETNYDLVLEAEFESFESLREYIVHPEHKKVGEFMRPLRESRACVDYEYNA